MRYKSCLPLTHPVSDLSSFFSTWYQLCGKVIWVGVCKQRENVWCGHRPQKWFWALESILPFSCCACYSELGFLQRQQNVIPCGKECLDRGWEENR